MAELLRQYVGTERLEALVGSLRDLVGGAVAVYEADGQYASAAFDSPYCAFLDQASRHLTGSDDPAEMMASGRWHCHESCWSEASRITVETGEPYDLTPCRGGISIYAVPVVAEGQVIGSMNFGYGVPPAEGQALSEVARRYQVDPGELAELARAVRTLTPRMARAAKDHLRVLADQLAELYLRRVAETRLRDSEALLNQTERLAGAGGWVWDVARQQGYWTAEIYRIHGLEPPQERAPITRADVELSLSCYGADMSSQVAAAFGRCQQSGEPYDIEGPFTARDGQERWVRTAGQGVMEGGRVVRVVGTLLDVSDRHRAEEAAARNTQLLDQASRLARVGAWNYDIAADRFEFADEWRELHGTTRRYSTLQDLVTLAHPDDLPAIQEAFSGALTEGRPYQLRHRILREDTGEVRYVNAYASLERDAEGHPARLWGAAQDVTGVVLMENALRESERKYRMLYDHAPLPYQSLDADGMILDVNPTWLATLGYGADEVLGRPFGDFLHPDYRPRFKERFPEFKRQGTIKNVQFKMRHKDGRYVDVSFDGSVGHRADGTFAQTYCVFKDITEEMRQQRQLEHLVRYDALTDLPNRVLLADRLHQGIAQALRRGTRLGVGYLDLDGFKAINDRYGHDAGDRFLAAIAQRMRHTLREGDTLARMGGDEFVAVFIDLDDDAVSLPLIRRLLNAAAAPIRLDDAELQVSASLGLRFYPLPGEGEVDPDQLLRQADQAMYQAKVAGKNRYRVFDTAEDISVRDFHQRLDAIRAALQRREFVLFYQPKVNLRTGEVVGAEALIRWRHPERGLLSPAEFLPVVEKDALSVDLGEWVMGEALDQLGRWCRAGHHIPVSVNVGAVHLQQEDFVERLQALLAQYPDVPPDHLWLEVVETSALEDMDHATQVLRGARQLGVRFALDDFGTGYASLRYLRHLPVAELKIDQSFVRDMLEDPEDLAILEGVLGLAVAFRQQVIAEGVETVEHGRLLVQLGCDLAQGYAIARPMEAKALLEWMAQWRPEPVWGAEPRVRHEDLPLVFAGVEHRAWQKALEDYALARREAPPPLDHHSCRFGKWLEQEGRSHYGGNEAFERVEVLHRQVHQRAADMPRFRDEGDTGAMASCLDDLHGVRGELLQALEALIQTGPAGGEGRAPS